MPQTNNNKEGVPNILIITFSNEGFIYDLQIQLFSQSDKDHLRITIINKSAASELYYQSIFTMETLPSDLKTIYDTLPQMFQYILDKYSEALEIQFEGQVRQSAIFNIKVLIIKKIKQYKLIINGKPLTEAMKQQANLFKLMKEIEAKEVILANLSIKQGFVKKELALNQRELERLAKDEKQLIQKVVHQIQIQQTQREKNAQLLSKIATKKIQFQSIYRELSKEGFVFTKQQINLFNQVVKPSKDSIGSVKKLRCDPQQSLNNKESSKQQMVKEKTKEKDNEFNANQREKIKEGIKVIVGQQNNMQKETQNKHKNNIPINNKPLARQNLKIQKVQNVSENILRNKRKLQIKDSSDNSNKSSALLHKQQKTIKQQPIESHKNNFSPFMQGSSQQFDFINIGSSIKSISAVKPQPIVTVLSSSSEEQEIDQYTKQIGQKVNLDFTSSENIGKYKIQSAKSRTYIERIFDDKNFYHLYHKHPICDKQNMQFNISQMAKHDFTFGIMGKDALKISSLDWPQEKVCWVGCNRQVVNKLQTRKKDYWIEPSDSITVAVDIASKTVSFYVNKKLMHKQTVQQSIVSECYFFFETASKGNKIYYF